MGETSEDLQKKQLFAERVTAAASVASALANAEQEQLFLPPSSRLSFENAWIPALARQEQGLAAILSEVDAVRSWPEKPDVPMETLDIEIQSYCA